MTGAVGYRYLKSVKEAYPKEGYVGIEEPIIAHLLGMITYIIELKRLYYTQGTYEQKGAVVGYLYFHISALLTLFDGVFNPNIEANISVTNSMYDLMEIDKHAQGLTRRIYRHMSRQEEASAIDIVERLEKIVRHLNDYCKDNDLSIPGILRLNIHDLGTQPIGKLLKLKARYGKRGRPSRSEMLERSIEVKENGLPKKKYRMRKPHYKKAGRPTYKERQKFKAQMARWLKQQERLKYEREQKRLERHNAGGMGSDGAAVG
jgi:hypothetical protein